MLKERSVTSLFFQINIKTSVSSSITTQFPHGISLGKVVENLDISISRRNIQHRLSFLVKKGVLHAEGRARARLYKLPSEGKKGAQISFEGNIARHRLRPAEYEAWHKIWR